MNNISTLKEIGINEVARKTHIEAEYLNHIVNKNYAKLVRLNVKGFAKILEREYDIDFTEWLSEYETFLAEHQDEYKQKTITVSPKIPRYEADDKRASGGFLLLVLLFIIGFAIWFFDGHKYLGQFVNFFEDKNRSISYSNATIVQEAAKNIGTITESNITLNLPTPSESNITINLPSAEPVAAPQTTDFQAPGAAETTSETNTTAILPAQPAKPDTNQTKVNIETNSTDGLKRQKFSVGGLEQITILPYKNRKIWIGIINLDNNYKKRSFDTTKDTNITIGDKQLLIVGGGRIDIKMGDNVVKFDTDSTKRFLIEKENLTRMSVDEFKALNRGKTW